MENLEKILEIKVDVNEAIKGITNLNKEIGTQKQKQKELQSQIKELSKDYVTNADKIESLQQELTKSKEITKSYTSQVQTLSKQIQNQLKVDKEQLGSMKQLRAQLSNLTNAYDEMSEAERDSAEGQELKDKINEVTDALKECEEETQRYYRNVGNYENAISNAIGLNGRFGTTLKNVAEATKNGIKPALSATAEGIKGVGKQLLKLLANPIVAIIAAIVAVIMAVIKAIKGSEERTAKLQAIFAKLKPILDIVGKVFGFLADVIMTLVEWVGKAIDGFMSLLEYLPFVGDYFKEINEEAARYVQIEKDKQKLVEYNRKLLIEESKATLEVESLKNKVKQKSLYTDQERLKFLQEASNIELELAKKKKYAAEENLRIMQEEMLSARKAGTLSAEQLDAEAEAIAEVNNVRAEYNRKIREMISEEESLKKEIEDEEKQRHEEELKRQEDEQKAIEAKKKAHEDYLKAVRKAAREAEDLWNQLIDGEELREIALEEERYKRQVEDLELEIAANKEKKELVDKLNSQLKAAELIHQNNLAEINKTFRDAEYEASIEAMEKEAEARALDWENRINEAKLKGEDYKQVTLEMLQDTLDNMHQLEEESDAEFKARMLAAQQEYADMAVEIEKEKTEKEVELEEKKKNALSGIVSGIAQMLEATAGDNKKRIKAAKVAALAEVMLNQGIAIASAVKAATPGDPYTTAIRIAAAVASTVVSMTQAINSIKEVKLARGGYVSGPGTSTSDSIPAMLSNGEFVVNARATSMFPELLETINNLGLGLGAPARMEKVTTTRIERDNAEALVKALQQMPAPVVSVEEINRTSRRVEALERLSRLA